MSTKIFTLNGSGRPGLLIGILSCVGSLFPGLSTLFMGRIVFELKIVVIC